MPITYLNYGLKYVRAYDDLLPAQHVVLYDLAMERGTEPIFDRLRNLDASLRNASCIVLRGRTEETLRAVMHDELSHSLLSGVPVLALFGSLSGGQIRLVQDGPFSAPDFSIPLEVLCAAEVRSILDRNECQWGPHNDIHYLLPSGDHAEAFIRLAGALQDPIEISRLADWIIPELGMHAGIVADNGSLLPLVLTLCLESLKLYGWDIRFRTIDSYPLDPSRIQSSVAELVKEIGPKGKIVFIVSVSATGRLVESILKQRVPIAHTVVTICHTGSPDTTRKTLLTSPIIRWGTDLTGRCSECSAKSVWAINERTYERVVKQELAPVSIRNTAAAKHREFWQAVDKMDAVRLHFDLVSEVDGTQRHYGIYIDVAKALQDSWLRQRSLVKLRQLRRPTVVIVPQHGASGAIADLVSEAFRDCDLLTVKQGVLESEAISRLHSLTADDEVLIADDALVTCTTLHNLRPQLNRIYKQSESMPSISAFAVLCRTARQNELQQLTNRFRDAKGVQLHFAYDCRMPPPQECPWCRERMHLVDCLPSLPEGVRETAAKRVRALTGEFRAPFLLGGEDADTSSRSVGSFFGELGPAAAFAAASSCMHEEWTLIDSTKESYGLSFRKHHVDVVKMINNYFADAFLPAVFRTMTPRQIDFGVQKEGIIEQLRKLDPRRTFPCLIPEFVWAVVEGKLPPLAGEVLLEKAPASSPILELLRELVPKTK